MSACTCGADEPCTARCARHDRVLHGYPCWACQDEWRQAHPRTAAAVKRGSQASLVKARREDAADHAEPCRWNCGAES